MIKVQTKGHKEFQRGIKKGIAEIAVTEEAQYKAARFVLPAARAAAPKLTGRLSQSLNVTHKGEIYSLLVYGNPVHWGWRGHGIEPNMFILNTARELEHSWISFFVDEMEEALDKIAR